MKVELLILKGSKRQSGWRSLWLATDQRLVLNVAKAAYGVDMRS